MNVEIKRKVSPKLKVFVAGHKGLVGSALVKILEGMPEVHVFVAGREELDLSDRHQVETFFQANLFDQIYLAAGKVGGINANRSLPANFIFENSMIAINVIDAAFKAGTKKLLYLGSNCMYPRNASHPITEEMILHGPPEQTNEAYAIAKILGLKMCESYMAQFGVDMSLDFRAVVPTSLYGPNDNYDRDNSHVVAGLIRKFHEAKEGGLKSVQIWGTGKPFREFLFVDDLAEACVFVMNLPRDEYQKVLKDKSQHVIVGSNEEMKISDLAFLIKDVVGFEGDIEFLTTMPDGIPRKLLDSQRIRSLGWSPTHSLKTGLVITYNHYLSAIRLGTQRD